MLLTKESLFKNNSSQCDNPPKGTNKETIQLTVVDSIVEMLKALEVRHAFGIGGGAIAPLWAALEQSTIQVLHFRHEAGAVFAAIEAYFANNSPVVVFTTTGPGITNALTGILSARCEGAKVILLSASTPAKLQGRCVVRETNIKTMPEEIFTPGTLFHYAKCIKSGDELPEIAHQLAVGLSRPGSFVAHITVPTDIQTSTGCNATVSKPLSPLLIPSKKITTKAVELLSCAPFAIWVGFGARDAAEEILQLAENTGVAVMSSPRGKGIFPENHPQFVGVTGFAGHQSVLEYMQSTPPERILVLGTRLGEFTSFWNPVMIPPKGFIHVDIDPFVSGAAYPTADTFPICAVIKPFLRVLLEKLPKKLTWSSVPSLSHPHLTPQNHQGSYDKQRQPDKDLVRPSVLMNTIQEVIVEGSDAIVIAEAGNSLAWTTHYLKFDQTRRWRVSTSFASMGHATTGVLGAALTSGSKAVAIVGDGAMLMNNEINTAVQYNIPVVWIVLNDACYNMCAQGLEKIGYSGVNTQFPPTDFVMFARSMGADGICVETESQLKTALSKAIHSKVPFVVDVKINPAQPAPIGTRLSSLITQYS
ncbi:MAG: thiamine pyrophosphate-binding protein [Stigonema ocellatum SAG 48.90 = DSM 106950]|nr:thiamine pyrophosphate-binding protein [Stigonema ocellatum SAG 48.90 = DSM 106950]